MTMTAINNLASQLLSPNPPLGVSPELLLLSVSQ